MNECPKCAQAKCRQHALLPMLGCAWMIAAAVWTALLVCWTIGPPLDAAFARHGFTKVQQVGPAASAPQTGGE